MGRPSIGEVAMRAERVRRFRQLRSVTKQVTELDRRDQRTQALEQRLAELEGELAANGAAKGMTVDEEWREGLTRFSEYLGVPIGEFANFLMQLGNEAFSRKFQHGLSNDIARWLIEMHSKYPDTFNVGAWEGSCTDLAIDKLYKRHGVPVGKYVEWQAEQDAKEDEATKRKAARAQKMEASGMRDKMEIDRELKQERERLKMLEDSRVLFPAYEDQEEGKKDAIADSRKRIRQLEKAARKAAEVVAAKKAAEAG